MVGGGEGGMSGEEERGMSGGGEGRYVTFRPWGGVPPQRYFVLFCMGGVARTRS